MSKEIQLQNGIKFIVDDEDFERVNQHRWVIRQNKNSDSLNIHCSEGYLGVFLIGKKYGHSIKHLNNNRLDFRKENLKHSNHNECVRQSKGRKGTSKYKGVSLHKPNMKWTANIHIDGKKYYLGLFDSEDEAARAYNSAVDKMLDGDAYKNTIGESNLRDVHKTENTPVKRHPLGYSGYRGVITDKRNKTAPYRAYINGKGFGNMHKKPEQAAKAYDQKAYELHGEKAILNFPENIEEYKELLGGVRQ